MTLTINQILVFLLIGVLIAFLIEMGILAKHAIPLIGNHVRIPFTVKTLMIGGIFFRKIIPLHIRIKMAVSFISILIVGLAGFPVCV